MFVSQVAQGISITLLQGDDLEHLIPAFLDTKRAEEVPSRTDTFYKKKLQRFNISEDKPNLSNPACHNQGVYDLPKGARQQ